MYQRGRPVDPHFEPDERLYLRVHEDHLDSGRLGAGAIRFTEQSVNRGKYSQPEWVLIPRFFDWAIAQFTVQDVPNSIASPGGPVFTFKTEHLPEQDNYSHSEIRTYKNRAYEKNAGKKVSNKVKLQFRAKLANAATIIKSSGIDSPIVD
jgi:hypothetical protein